jgi:hypothetical protein
VLLWLVKGDFVSVSVGFFCKHGCLPLDKKENLCTGDRVLSPLFLLNILMFSSPVSSRKKMFIDNLSVGILHMDTLLVEFVIRILSMNSHDFLFNQN